MLQTAKIASNCVRTILLNSNTTPADMTIHRYLLPRLISFVVDLESNDPEDARSLVCQALTQYVATSIPLEKQAVGMVLVFTMLLKRASEEGQAVYQETCSRFLELAAVDQAAFKGIVSGLGEEQRGCFEKVLMSGRQMKKNADEAGQEQPTIALKMNFGSE